MSVDREHEDIEAAGPNGLAMEAARTPGTVTTDADLTAMQKIGRIIGRLDEDEKGRVVRYLAEKYAQYLS